MQEKLERNVSHSTSVLVYAKAFFSGTLISRFSGMMRDILLAMFFGTSQFLASFMVAFRFANLFRRLFAESALSSSFVPMLEKKRKQSEKLSDFFFRDVFVLLLSVGTVVTAFLEGCVFFSSYFLKGTSFFEILPFIHIMLPSIVFLMLYGLFSAYLQCSGKYFIGAFSPVAFNIIWCIFAFFAKSHSQSGAMTILSWGVNVAFFAQLILTAFVAVKSFSKSLSKTELFSSFSLKESAKEIFKPYVLGMIGISAVQLNTLLDSLFAKIADGSGPAYLWYAIRIQQVPLSLFSIALAAAMLPTLSRVLKQNSTGQFQTTLNATLRKNILLLSFSSIGLVVLGFMSLRLIFFRGAFDVVSLGMTLKCLWGYLLGLVFQGSVIVLSQGFYAKHDFKTPVKASAIAVAINISCNALFVFGFKLGAVSIALATSFASIFQFFYLQAKFRQHSEIKNFYFSLKCLTISSVAAIATVAFCSFVKDPSFQVLRTFGSVENVLSFSKTATHFLLAGLIFALVFFLGAKALSLDEVFSLFQRKSKG